MDNCNGGVEYEAKDQSFRAEINIDIKVVRTGGVMLNAGREMA